MPFCEKLIQLRRERGLSQEQLADLMNVSRQAVSKWEAGQATPELAKLLALADLFGVSLDGLVRGETREGAGAAERDALAAELRELRREIRRGYEYKSKCRLFGLPLVHVKLSPYGMATAKGVLAIGNTAVGVVSLGGLSIGAVSFGGLSLGLLALGGMAAGALALGGCGFGLLAFGGLAVGIDAFGGTAIAHSLAVGAQALGEVAVGVNPSGEHTLQLDGATAEQVRLFLAQHCPGLWGWLRELVAGLCA